MTHHPDAKYHHYVTASNPYKNAGDLAYQPPAWARAGEYTNDPHPSAQLIEAKGAMGNGWAMYSDGEGTDGGKHFGRCGLGHLTVGTPVTRRPPHRPGRAVFPHPVPRLYSLSRRTITTTPDAIAASP